MTKAKEFVPGTCTPKVLEDNLLVPAARIAREHNAANMPPMEHIYAHTGMEPTEEFIAVVTSKYWKTDGVRLTVGFMDNPPKALRTRILSHMNAWNKTANVQFVESDTDPQVRISRGKGGYWSYLGTDILLIDKDKQTMNLEGFTMKTPDSEFHRVVRHETGHTLGCPHEHMRKKLVDRIDPAKAIKYFGATQGWSPEQVRRQVLTPLDPSTIKATSVADENSIMCYHIPGGLTKDGKPILGGTDIDASDYAFMGKVYPKPKHDTPATKPHLDAGHAPPGDGHHQCSGFCWHLPNGTRFEADRDISLQQLQMIIEQTR